MKKIVMTNANLKMVFEAKIGVFETVKTQLFCDDTVQAESVSDKAIIYDFIQKMLSEGWKIESGE